MLFLVFNLKPIFQKASQVMVHHTGWAAREVDRNSHIYDYIFKGLQARENQKAPLKSYVFLCLHILKLDELVKLK